MKKLVLIFILSYAFFGMSQDYPRQNLDVDVFVDDLFLQQDEGVTMNCSTKTLLIIIRIQLT